MSFDPATGERLWKCAVSEVYVCPSVIANNGIVYASHYRGCVAVRAGGWGDVTENRQIWSAREAGSNVCSPVYHDGYLYGANDENGIVYCINAASGELAYRQRLQPRPGRIYASPIVVDGKIYYLSRENGTYVLPARPQFELLSHNTIESDDSVFNATPVPSRGQLLLRSDQFLYCVGE